MHLLEVGLIVSVGHLAAIALTDCLKNEFMVTTPVLFLEWYQNYQHSDHKAIQNVGMHAVETECIL